jgi:hypothetical protein
LPGLSSRLTIPEACVTTRTSAICSAIFSFARGAADVRFTEEASLGFGVQPMLGANRFQRNAGLEGLVESRKDRAHAAFPKGVEHAIVRDTLC